MTASGEEVRGWRDGGKRTQGHGQHCGGSGGGTIRGINGNGKNKN